MSVKFALFQNGSHELRFLAN